MTKKPCLGSMRLSRTEPTRIIRLGSLGPPCLSSCSQSCEELECGLLLFITSGVIWGLCQVMVTMETTGQCGVMVAGSCCSMLLSLPSPCSLPTPLFLHWALVLASLQPSWGHPLQERKRSLQLITVHNRAGLLHYTVSWPLCGYKCSNQGKPGQPVKVWGADRALSQRNCQGWAMHGGSIMGYPQFIHISLLILW